VDQDFIKRLKASSPGPLTPQQRELLQDMRFVIDFVLDHNLSMELALKILSHDFAGIIQHGGVDKAVSEGFLPKSRDFSNYR
jgi:hypothetical protein